MLLQQPGTLLLLVSHLRPVPDAERDLLEVGPLGVQELRDDGVRVSVLGKGGGRRQERGEQQGEWQTGNAHHEGTSRLGGWRLTGFRVYPGRHHRDAASTRYSALMTKHGFRSAWVVLLTLLFAAAGHADDEEKSGAREGVADARRDVEEPAAGPSAMDFTLRFDEAAALAPAAGQGFSMPSGRQMELFGVSGCRP